MQQITAYHFRKLHNILNCSIQKYYIEENVVHSHFQKHQQFPFQSKVIWNENAVVIKRRPIYVKFYFKPCSHLESQLLVKSMGCFIKKKKKIIANYVISELSDTRVLQSSFKNNSTSENHDS